MRLLGMMKTVCHHDYLYRLIDLSKSWKLITDIEECFLSIPNPEREDFNVFVKDNTDCIRHISNLHAKLLIGSTKAMLGSANFTTSGIQHRTEMGVLIDEPEIYSELCDWFNCQWNKAVEIPIGDLDEIASSLPEPSIRQPNYFDNSNQVSANLIELDEDPRILHYHNKKGEFDAKGYYIRFRREFFVLKGSIAKGNTSKAFDNIPKISGIRKNLIKDGILKKRQDENYIFTEDYVFDNPSNAACVVSGNSRSGEVWKPL